MSEQFDLVIIGAGPGGYSTALRAAELGMKVALVERDATVGGTCRTVAASPPRRSSPPPTPSTPCTVRPNSASTPR